MMPPSNNSKGISTVVNISGLLLNDSKINLLSKGLSFCPILRHIYKIKIMDDL